ncbi:MAG: hypothetical protein HDR39_00450 [Treponema sp.]|nr:hypothetical protein [Treponema sp.]
MGEEKKKMSTGKKVLIGIGIYLGLGIVGIALYGIPTMIENSQKQKQVAEAEALTNLAEMDAIYASHDPQVFLGYALVAAGKQDRITVHSVQPDVYSCIVEADISGYVYSMSDDGADADGMVAAACLFAFDCSEEIFRADEHIDTIFYYFRVKNKLDHWIESAVGMTIDRPNFEKIDYDEFRLRIQSDYNDLASVVNSVIFTGEIENRLKKITNNLREKKI